MSGAPKIESDKIPTCPALPIDMAPRDGRVFVAIDYLGEPYLVCADERGYFNYYNGEEIEELSWWTPIPAIPTDESRT